MFVKGLQTDVQKFSDKFHSYLVGERKSGNTVRQYTYMARKFLEFLGRPPASVSEADVERYKQHMVSVMNYSKASQHLAINSVKLLLKSNGVKPPLNLTTPRRSRKMPVYLSQREASTLLDMARKDIRKFAIVNTLIYTGMRVGELCSLDIDDVDLDERVIGIRSGKGDKGRIVIIPDECADAIDEYLLHRSRLTPPTQALFVSNKRTRFETSSIERIIRKLASESGIKKKVTPHVLRHTFATTIMRNGGDIRFIQEILGHSSVATTQIYTHIDENTLKEMYSRHRPRF